MSEAFVTALVAFLTAGVALLKAWLADRTASHARADLAAARAQQHHELQGLRADVAAAATRGYYPPKAGGG